MRNNDEIIKIISELKEEKNWSLNELARRVGISKSSMSRYFSKTRAFPINKVGDFAKVLGVTPEYLLGFNLQKNKENNPKHRSKSNSLTEPSSIDEHDIEKGLENLLKHLNKKSYDSVKDYNLMKQLLEDALQTHKTLSNKSSLMGNNKEKLSCIN